MKLLILNGFASGDAPGSRAGSRADQLLRRALRGGGTTLVVRAVASGAGRGLGASATVTELALEPDQFAARTPLDGIVRDFAPDAILALGLGTLPAVAQLSPGVPCWLDFDADPFDRAARPALPWGEERELDFAHRLVWAIDRVDATSCPDAQVQRTLRGLLALRGVFPGASHGALAPQIIGEDGTGIESLDAWLRDPRSRPPAARVMGQPEIVDFVRARDGAARVAELERRLAFRLGRLARAASRKLARGAAVVLDGLAAAARLPRLATAYPKLVRRVGPSSQRGLGGGEPIDLGALELRLGRRARLLLVMPYRIYPPRHGGAVRLYGLLRQLAERCDLFLLRFDQRGECRLERNELERFCRRVEYHHWVVPPAAPPRSSFVPRNAWLFQDERAAWRIRQLVESESIDVVQLEYAEMGQYATAAGGAAVILVEHDVAFRSLARRREVELSERFADRRYHGASWRDLVRLYRYEIRACRAADEIHTMSVEDARHLAAHLPASTRLRVVPNAVDSARLAPPEPAPHREGALFIGNFENLPNRDALEWLLEEIWPRVRERQPETALTVAGARMPAEIASRQRSEGVTVIGEVDDPATAYHRHRVLVVPLRAGSGTRLKILEAFAAGLPVVSTRLGAEGLEVEDGRHLLLADDEEGFAEAVARLLTDEELGRRLAESARRLVRERYDVSSAAQLNYTAVLQLACRGERMPEPVALPPLAPPTLEVSVILPTRSGGRLLERTLVAIAGQATGRSFEVICIDSGSPPEELAAMRAAGARVIEIPPASFNHGRTRDLGAAHSRGRVLVFLNQDAVPADAHWLERLTEPLFAAVPPAAVQGGIQEFPPQQGDAPRRFFWDSGGPRFNFTRESQGWIARHGGIGFSTVNCAMRREIWRAIPFGWMPILEDKLWQRTAVEREHRIVAVNEALVHHTHDYDLPGLLARSRAEGEGWRWLGERYRLRDALGDACRPSVWREWWRGARRGELGGWAGRLFPVVRPLALYWGNRRASRALR